MNMTKRVAAALMAVIVIFIITYNEYTVTVNATEVVVGGELIDYLISFIVSAGATYMGYEILEGWDSNTVTRELHGYCNTTEGSSALKGCYGSFKVIDGGGGSDPEPPEDPDEILDTKVAGLAVTKELFDLVSGFFSYASKSEDSVIGASINATSGQQVTVISPLPDYMHIASESNRIYSDSMDYLIKQTYPEYSMLNNYYVQLINNGGFYSNILLDQTSLVVDSFWLKEDLGSDNYSVYALDSVGNKLNVLTRYYAFAAHVYKMIDSSSFGSSISSIFDIYVFGNIYISLSNGELYHVYPDGTVEQLFEDQPAQKVKFSLSTAEGYLTSVKPIVNMDISAFVDAIGKAISDAHPDEVPSLSPEAVAAILSGVAGVYDDAVTNYYNDTSYIDQSQYITNITNVYEQAIAENDPAVDTPVIAPILGNLNSYNTYGLSSVFPFCIPFDMYDLISVLVAEPKAISFDWNFYFGENIGEYVYTVDLSIFDPVMKVVRTTELILYMIGLMILTRSLIRG